MHSVCVGVDTMVLIWAPEDSSEELLFPFYFNVGSLDGAQAARLAQQAFTLRIISLVPFDYFLRS